MVAGQLPWETVQQKKNFCVSLTASSSDSQHRILLVLGVRDCPWCRKVGGKDFSKSAPLKKVSKDKHLVCRGLELACSQGELPGLWSGIVTNFIFLGSKITADGDCSHEIKRHLLLGRKATTNLDSILKSRDIALLTKVHLVKAMVFPVVMYGCES